ncbi:MAG: type II secretion system F family protein [Methanobrevibacter sp.]|uniref:type II secretion system F family protein n=1 Tax=Methanobrevibacter sp. TaxID=66852 RepID=UPI0025DB1F7B|nr:type II secretion system F family protein [Methanobrevibacter sp.]MBR0271598.1 type II secretion system F family protein [Methanobrevibacter sp.]
MKFKSIILISEILENKIPEKYLESLREFLLSGSIFIETSEFLAGIIIFILVTEIILVTISFILNLPSSILFIPFLIFPAIYTYVSVKHERNVAEIEQSAPDFLRQLSSMLQVGLSFENAMEDMSKYGKGPLYDEMRRTIIEIRMGRNFDEAWIAMSRRLKSRELERIFGIILDGRKSGSSMAGVIMDVSNDLRDLLAIKRERKSSVMMAVMFLIISAVIATPFALGMVSVYGGFMESFGQVTDIVAIAPIAGQMYLVIHSFLIGFIISIIMYGEVKKGIKFSIPLVVASVVIFYSVSNFGTSMLM